MGRQKKKKRLMRGARLINKLEAIFSPEIRGIPLARERRVGAADAFAVEKQLDSRRIRKIKTAESRVQRPVEAAPPWCHPEILADVPFAGHGGGKPGGGEGLRAGGGLGIGAASGGRGGRGRRGGGFRR